MKKRMGFAMLFSALCLVTAGASRAEVITNTQIPVSIDINIPCANGGAGDLVHLEGDLHVLLTLTLKDSTHASGKEHFQPMGMSGLGTSGAKYQATGVTQDRFEVNLINGQATFTYNNNFHIIGQGPGNNFIVHENVHITINANGTVTATVDNFKVDCK